MTAQEKRTNLQNLLSKYAEAVHKSFTAIDNDYWYDEDETQELMDTVDEIYSNILNEFAPLEE